MPRCVCTLAAAALVLATACASAPEAADQEPVPATEVPGTEPEVVVPRPTGTFVPTTAAPVDPASLPVALQRIEALAGGDPAEAGCIRQGLVASLGPDIGRPDAYAGAAGTTVAQCLPPAKLAATLTDHLRDPALGLGLGPSELACARATLASAAITPEYTVLVGGVALADPAVVRQGAGPLDAACGTNLSA